MALAVLARGVFLFAPAKPSNAGVISPQHLKCHLVVPSVQERLSVLPCLRQETRSHATVEPLPMLVPSWIAAMQSQDRCTHKKALSGVTLQD